MSSKNEFNKFSSSNTGANTSFSQTDEEVCMSLEKQASLVQEILNNPNYESEKRLSRINKQEIKDWHKENAGLIDPVVEEIRKEPDHRQANKLVKEWFYNVEGTNTGKRIAPKFNKDEEPNYTSRSNRQSDEYVMGVYYDHNGRERKIYDDGGNLGTVERAFQQSITTGDTDSVGRDLLFEQGLNHGEFHVTDEMGNTVGFMTTEAYESYKRTVEAQTRADVGFLKARFEKRRPLEEEMRDRAKYYYNLIYNQIKRYDNYGDMKRLIYKSRSLVFAGLRRDFPEKITATGAIFIYPPVKYGTTDQNLSNMNFLFHKVESQKLWKAVDESKWKSKHLEKLKKAKGAYNKLMSAISIAPNPLDQADLIQSNKVVLSSEDADLVLVHARSKSNHDRLTKPVYDAVLQRKAA